VLLDFLRELEEEKAGWEEERKGLNSLRVRAPRPKDQPHSQIRISADLGTGGNHDEAVEFHL